MNMLTTSEAAERKGCPRITIIKAIDTGRLSAEKFGRDWMIFEDKKFRNFEVGRAGRPRGKPAKDE
jgi:excisionase family DNA binding protein